MVPRPRERRVGGRGTSLLRKSRLLGELTGIATLTLYWCPSRLRWRLGVHLPTGWEFPDLNRMVSDALMASSTPGTSEHIFTHTQPNYSPEHRDQPRQARKIRKLSSHVWTAGKLLGLAEQDPDVCAPSARVLADDGAAALQDNQFFGSREPRRPKSIILHGYSHETRHWDTCFPATSAASPPAGGAEEVDVPNETAMDTVSGTVSEGGNGGNGDRACAGCWQPKNSASRYDTDVGQLESAGVSGDATGSINDGPAPATAGCINPGPADIVSADDAAGHIDSDSLLSRPTDGYSAAESDVNEDLEAATATPVYEIWMRLAQGPLLPAEASP